MLSEYVICNIFLFYFLLLLLGFVRLLLFGGELFERIFVVVCLGFSLFVF